MRRGSAARSAAVGQGGAFGSPLAAKVDPEAEHDARQRQSVVGVRGAVVSPCQTYGTSTCGGGKARTRLAGPPLTPP